MTVWVCTSKWKYKGIDEQVKRKTEWIDSEIRWSSLVPSVLNKKWYRDSKWTLYLLPLLCLRDVKVSWTVACHLVVEIWNSQREFVLIVISVEQKNMALNTEIFVLQLICILILRHVIAWCLRERIFLVSLWTLRMSQEKSPSSTNNPDWHTKWKSEIKC